MAYRPVPDLKKKYDATWALMTGAGTGIGKAIAFKLARQGLNVVVVSLDDDYLKATMKQLKENFPVFKTFLRSKLRNLEQLSGFYLNAPRITLIIFSVF